MSWILQASGLQVPDITEKQLRALGAGCRPTGPSETGNYCDSSGHFWNLGAPVRLDVGAGCRKAASGVQVKEFGSTSHAQGATSRIQVVEIGEQSVLLPDGVEAVAIESRPSAIVAMHRPVKEPICTQYGRNNELDRPVGRSHALVEARLAMQNNAVAGNWGKEDFAAGLGERRASVERASACFKRRSSTSRRSFGSVNSGVFTALGAPEEIQPKEFLRLSVPYARFSFAGEIYEEHFDGDPEVSPNYVSSVTLGGLVEGEIIHGTGHPKDTIPEPGERLWRLKDASVLLRFHGGPPIEGRSLKESTLTEALRYLDQQWVPKAWLMPSVWTILWIETEDTALTLTQLDKLMNEHITISCPRCKDTMNLVRKGEACIVPVGEDELSSSHSGSSDEEQEDNESDGIDAAHETVGEEKENDEEENDKENENKEDLNGEDSKDVESQASSEASVDLSPDPPPELMQEDPTDQEQDAPTDATGGSRRGSEVASGSRRGSKVASKSHPVEEPESPRPSRKGSKESSESRKGSKELSGSRRASKVASKSHPLEEPQSPRPGKGSPKGSKESSGKQKGSPKGSKGSKESSGKRKASKEQSESRQESEVPGSPGPSASRQGSPVPTSPKSPSGSQRESGQDQQNIISDKTETKKSSVGGNPADQNANAESETGARRSSALAERRGSNLSLSTLKPQELDAKETSDKRPEAIKDTEVSPEPAEGTEINESPKSPNSASKGTKSRRCSIDPVIENRIEITAERRAEIKKATSRSSFGEDPFRKSTGSKDGRSASQSNSVGLAAAAQRRRSTWEGSQAQTAAALRRTSFQAMTEPAENIPGKAPTMQRGSRESIKNIVATSRRESSTKRLHQDGEGAPLRPGDAEKRKTLSHLPVGALVETTTDVVAASGDNRASFLGGVGVVCKDFKMTAETIRSWELNLLACGRCGRMGEVDMAKACLRRGCYFFPLCQSCFDLQVYAIRRQLQDGTIGKISEEDVNMTSKARHAPQQNKKTGSICRRRQTWGTRDYC